MSQVLRKFERVGVLMGGASRERDVSLNTGTAVSTALAKAGYDVVTIDWRPGQLGELQSSGVDVVFLALHGGHGEGGSAQGLMNCLDIPYTGAGVTASALAMDKVHSKRLFRQADLSTPDFEVVSAGAVARWLAAGEADLALEPPVVVKPAAEGSSFGVSIVTTEDGILPALRQAQHGSDAILVERFVDGIELSVGVFDEQVLGTVAIVPADGFYDYDAKYLSKTTNYLIPPPVSAAAKLAAEQLARRAYDLLGCRGVARIDVMLDGDDQPWLLEINTLPGMTATSLIPKLANAIGESFSALVARMVEAARIDKY